MQLSTRTRYGSRAMVELARVYPERAISVREISEKQHISAKYLEQIITTLKVGGLISPVRGMHGGYRLTRAPEEISLQDVFGLLEGSAAPVYCVDHPETCPARSECPTHQTWVEIRDAIAGVLERKSLSDLAKQSDST